MTLASYKDFRRGRATASAAFPVRLHRWRRLRRAHPGQERQRSHRDRASATRAARCFQDRPEHDAVRSQAVDARGARPDRHLGHVRSTRRGASRSGRVQCRRTVHALDGLASARSKKCAKNCPAPIWYQLYVIKDRGFMREMLSRAKAVGAQALVFTVDMPVPGARYRDAHSGMSGRYAPLRRVLQAMGRPGWSWDVGLHGRPHSLGNLKSVLGAKSGSAITWAGWARTSIPRLAGPISIGCDRHGTARSSSREFWILKTRSRRRKSAPTASLFPIMAAVSWTVCCHQRAPCRRLPMQ